MIDVSYHKWHLSTRQVLRHRLEKINLFENFSRIRDQFTTIKMNLLNTSKLKTVNFRLRSCFQEIAAAQVDRVGTVDVFPGPGRGLETTIQSRLPAIRREQHHRHRDHHPVVETVAPRLCQFAQTNRHAASQLGRHAAQQKLRQGRRDRRLRLSTLEMRTGRPIGLAPSPLVLLPVQVQAIAGIAAPFFSVLSSFSRTRCGRKMCNFTDALSMARLGDYYVRMRVDLGTSLSSLNLIDHQKLSY